METRRERIRREQAGLHSSPFRHLPNTPQPRARAPRKKTPAVETNEIGNSSNSSERVSLAGEDDLKVPSGFPSPITSDTALQT